MSRTWLPLWCIALVSLMTGTLFAQDAADPRKWNQDPRTTAIQATGQQAVIPRGDPNYVHKNTTPKLVYTPYEALTINPNIRVHPSTTTSQSEVPITRHPTNGNILYASSNAVHFTPSLFISEGMYLSTDGGTTWFGSDTTAAAPIGGHSGDPAPAIGPDGTLYMSEITSGMGVEYSTNMGATWSGIITLATGSQDKNHTFVNDVPASPYYGRAYVTWSLFTAATPPAVVSWSSNNGVSWNGPVNVLTPPAGHYQQGVNGTVGANGDAYICWQSPVSASPFTGDFVGFAKSTDGGVTWSGSANAFDCNGARNSSLAPWSIRINDFPSMAVDRSGGGRNGWIYIVVNEKGLAPAGADEDIIMHLSSDAGATWSPGIRVNQDALNNGKKQYMPWVCVDAAGGVNVVYYDNRNSAAGDSVEVMVSRSLDGGTTWTDIVVSDHRFKPAPIPGLAGGYQGDYIGITAANGKIYPYWADNSTGIYQAWVTSVTTTEGFGWAKGTITNVSGGAPLANVSVDFTNPIPQVPGTSTPAGLYYAGAKVDTPATTLNVTLRARKFGFRDTLINLTITRADTITRNFAMTPVPSGTLVVRTVRKDSSNIQSAVTVLFAGSPVATGNTDSLTGIYSTSLPVGSYDVLIDPPSPFGSKRFNGVSVTTGTTPLYVVVRTVLENSPSAVRDTLSVGQVHAKTLALSNTTPDTVRFRITDDNALRPARIKVIVPEPAVQQKAIERPKGAPDIEHGDSPDGHGGPDGFGYSWIDSDEPGGPPVQFNDISSTGIQITTVTSGTLDDGYATIPLPFSFPLYGNTYSSINICTNGFVNFGTGSTSLTNTTLPTAAVPNNGVYAFWDDLDFRFRGKLMYFNDVANGQFIIQYHQVPRYNSGGAAGELDTLTFQLLMRPNGEVLVNYGRMYTALAADLNSASIGLENAAGTVGLQTVFNAAYMHNNLTVRFYLPDASWLSETPTLGAIPPGGNQNIQVTFDASGLLAGTTYNANLFIEATHPDVSSPFIVPASLKVNTASGPLIILTRTSVSFPSTEIGTSRKDSLTVRNGGSATLNLTSVTTTNARFTAVAVSSSLLPGDSTRIRITYSPLAPAGSDTGRVIVLSNDPALPRVDVTLTGTSLRVAHIVASPDSFVFVRQTGTDTTTAILKIRNPGTDTLRYNINETTLAFDRIAGHQETMKQPVLNEPLDLPKEAVDTRQGVAGIDGAGGPDAFGYRWIDSDEPGGPAFSWIDISATGTALDSGSAWIKTATSTFVRYDEGYYAVALPFTFSFYGVAKDSVFIGTNGTVSFQRATADAYTNAVFPTPGGSIDNNIGVWWDDQEVSQSAKVYYGTSGGSFVIMFKDMRLFSGGHNGAANNTFEVILSPGGLIKMQYLTMGAAGGSIVLASIGIENATGSIGLQSVFNAAYMHNNLAIVYTSDLLPWLTTDRLSGTVVPGDSQNVQLRVVGNQPAGNYFGHLRISGNTPDVASIGVRLNLTTDVEAAVNIIPTVFALNQNYPNPFNPTTRITYDLPEIASVTLKIYNVLGQEVATLANGPQAPGRYEALWDGRNSFGNQVASGVYFYRIDATRSSGQTFANIKKMLFLK